MEVINRKANYDYEIIDTYEAGVVLTGTEIKSIRLGRITLKDSYAIIKNNEIFLLNVHISSYEQGNRFNHDELRTRKLLLHKKEIIKLKEKIDKEGFTIIPLKLYFVKGKEKILLETIIEEMYMEFTEKRCGYKAVLKGYLTVLLSYIFRRMLPQNTNFKTIPYEITEYISKNLEKKLTLEELSKKCFYSPKYFGHIFKECYGITVTEYIQKKRIEESCRLLKETTLPIAEIGRRIGYDDAVRFYRYFKKFCGVTPNQYRKGL